MSYNSERCPACKRRPDPRYDHARKDGELAIEVFKCEVCGKRGCELCMHLNSYESLCKRCKKDAAGEEIDDR